MRHIFSLLVLFFGLTITVNADTVTHVYDRAPAVVVNPVELHEEKSESMFETKEYNQALVVLGFAGVFTVVGGFAYLLTKKKH